MEGVTTLSPNSYPGTNANGFWQGTSTPRGPAVNVTAVSVASATVLSVTGKGKLRFLSLGRSSAGDVVLTVTIDGVNVINAATYAISGSLNTYFNVPVVGAVNASFSGTTSYLMAVLDEEGLPFESSLTITIGNNSAGAAMIAHAYKLL